MLPVRVLCGIGCLLLSGTVAAQSLNWFEWSSVAPIVVSGRALGESGKQFDFEVLQVFRAPGELPERMLLEVRRANRERSRNVDPRGLKMEAGAAYIVLAKERPSRKRGRPATYELVRGVRGVRELPAEGAEAFARTFGRLVRIQQLPGDTQRWLAFTELLGETEPLLLETALAQFLKFRRGEPQMLLSLRPLLDHPDPALREDTARLIGQILARYPSEVIPEITALRSELIARARRDRSVPVRVAATEALGAFEAWEIGTILDEIARSDPEQEVRYAAEKLILEGRQAERKQRAVAGE